MSEFIDEFLGGKDSNEDDFIKPLSDADIIEIRAIIGKCPGSPSDGEESVQLCEQSVEEEETYFGRNRARVRVDAQLPAFNNYRRLTDDELFAEIKKDMKGLGEYLDKKEKWLASLKPIDYNESDDDDDDEEYLKRLEPTQSKEWLEDWWKALDNAFEEVYGEKADRSLNQYPPTNTNKRKKNSVATTKKKRGRRPKKARVVVAPPNVTQEESYGMIVEEIAYDEEDNFPPVTADPISEAKEELLEPKLEVESDVEEKPPKIEIESPDEEFMSSQVTMKDQKCGLLSPKLEEKPDISEENPLKESPAFFQFEGVTSQNRESSTRKDHTFLISNVKQSESQEKNVDMLEDYDVFQTEDSDRSSQVAEMENGSQEKNVDMLESSVFQTENVDRSSQNVAEMKNGSQEKNVDMLEDFDVFQTEDVDRSSQLAEMKNEQIEFPLTPPSLVHKTSQNSELDITISEAEADIQDGSSVVDFFSMNFTAEMLNGSGSRKTAVKLETSSIPEAEDVKPVVKRGPGRPRKNPRSSTKLPLPPKPSSPKQKTTRVPRIAPVRKSTRLSVQEKSPKSVKAPK